MAELSEIERLQERRRLLVAQSARHREDMSQQLENLHGAASWVERGFSVVGILRSVWPMVVTFAGLVVARKTGLRFQKLGKWWTWWRLGRQILSMWRRPEEERVSS